MFEEFATLLTTCQAAGSVPRRDGRRIHRSIVAAGPPASDADIAHLEWWFGHALPPDYRAFLQRWDGAQLFAIQGAIGPADPNPSIFSAAMVPERQFHFQDRRVLVIGMLDDEAYFILDRRRPDAPEWPVWWADEGETAEGLLTQPPIAGSFAEFIQRYVAAQGESYLEPPPPPLRWQTMPPEGIIVERWIHGLGVSLSLLREPRMLYLLGLPSGDPYGVTPEGLLIAAGLRNRLLAMGAQPMDPATISWETTGNRWLFTVSAEPQQHVDAGAVAPVPTPEGWREVAPGMWVFGAEGVGHAALFVLRSNNHGRHGGAYNLGWKLGSGEVVVASLRQRLAALGSYVTSPKYLPEGYEAEQYHWWKENQLLPDVRP